MVQLPLGQKMGREQIFKNTFQGIFSDQKICKDCPHRSVHLNSFHFPETLFVFRIPFYLLLCASIRQVRARGNLHGSEPRRDVVPEFRNLIGPVCPRRSSGGQQRLLLREVQGKGAHAHTQTVTCTPVSSRRGPYTHHVRLCLQRTTVKRTCIKSLPTVLCIHLMRFGFDWESGRSIKYDEQIRVGTAVSVSTHDVTAATLFIYLTSPLCLGRSSPGC